MCNARSTKKERKTAATCNLLTKGDSFISAFSCQHPRWVTPAKTGTVIFNLSERLADSSSPQRLDVSRSHSWNIKAKSEPGAYVIVGHTLKVSPRSCWTGQATCAHKRPRGLRVFVRTRNPIHHFIRLLSSPNRYYVLQSDSASPYLPLGPSCHHGWECV